MHEGLHRAQGPRPHTTCEGRLATCLPPPPAPCAVRKQHLREGAGREENYSAGGGGDTEAQSPNPPPRGGERGQGEGNPPSSFGVRPF